MFSIQTRTFFEHGKEERASRETYPTKGRGKGNHARISFLSIFDSSPVSQGGESCRMCAHQEVPQRGAWVAQSVGRPTSAQVTISRSASSSPASGSVLTAWSLFQIVSSLSLCPSPVHALSLSVSKINKC